MEYRSASFGITGIGLVVAVAALAFRETPSAPRPEMTVAVAPGPPVKESDVVYPDPDSAVKGYDRGRRLLAEYYARPWSQLSAHRDTTALQRIPLRVTIVTIPDPYDSHMDWSYDANLEALRRAMGTAGLVPQNFWLPLRSDSVRVVTDGVIVRYSAHDYQPGVFLFRSTNSDLPSLHILYLIPELPTSGLHMQTFRAALAERQTIMREGRGIFAVDARERVELSVLGPNFSGSSASLRALIDSALNSVGAAEANDVAPRTARLVSGSATSFNNLRVLTDSSCVLVRRRDVRNSESVWVARIRFAATVNPDEALDEVLRDVIDSLHVAPHQVAVLTESGTAYGAARPSHDPGDTTQRATARSPACTDREQSVMGADPDATDRTKSAARKSVESRTAVDGGALATPDEALRGPRYLTVPFPLNIASLRSEFERFPATLESSPNLPRLSEAPRTRLSLDEAARSRESPSFTSNLSVASLDIVLAGLIRTLKEHDIRVVVIKATDVRDKLMLAREVRRGVRDVVVVVYEGHLLLRRPEYSDALRGALVLSSYPMALENQFWATSRRRADSAYVRLNDLLAFPTDAAIGTYNAALAILGLPQMRVEFALHNAFVRDSTYTLPPVWLSVVGRDGFYPLRARVPSARWQGYLGGAPSALGPASQSFDRPHEHSYTHNDSWLSLIIIAPALLIVGLLSMFLIGRQGLNRWGLVLPSALARPKGANETLYLALFVLSLTATYLPFSVAIDARHIVASVDPYVGGLSVAMKAVLLLSLLVVLMGVVLLGNGIAGLLLASDRRQRSAGGAALRNATTSVVPPGTSAPPAVAVVQRTPEKPIAVVNEVSAARPAREAFWTRVTGQLQSLGVAIGEQLRQMRDIPRLNPGATATPRDDDVDEYPQQTTRTELPGMRRLGLLVIALASVAFVVASLAYTWHLVAFTRKGGIEATLSMYRALHLTSGVSPLLPLVLLGSGFASWTWWQLQQARNFDHADHFEDGVRSLAHPADAAALWRRAYRAMVDARRGLSWMAPGLGVLGILFAIAIVAWLLLRQRLPSLELLADTAGTGDGWFDLALWLGLVSLMVSTAWAIYRLAHTWNGLERFLDIIAGTPLSSAFARLPLDVARLTDVGFLGYRRDERNDERFADELWRNAQRDMDADTATNGANGIGTSMATGLRNAQEDGRSDRSVHGAFASLSDAWTRARTRPDPSKDVPVETDGGPPERVRAVRALEDYMACEVVLYVEQYLQNLRRLCFFLFASLLILVVVGAAYPYQPHSVISVASIALLAATVVTVFFVMIRMSRNAALSRIARTEPGKVTWDTTLILNIVTFGVVPLLALASSEFPEVRSFLFSWADPLMRAVVKT